MPAPIPAYHPKCSSLSPYPVNQCISCNNWSFWSNTMLLVENYLSYLKIHVDKELGDLVVQVFLFLQIFGQQFSPSQLQFQIVYFSGSF
ncbi:hypothetical protein BpHYR1_022012 [Brachionus plicatilis]|uniref:Uncharacterized protein n=1 Tax=Brachionus plicatilis TaxID=10195 RepID=A0A3M7PMF6_BRAPC|nr:hypothetical protein BpHYR1_022012 [Brachionus plicatilis]